MIDYGLRGVAIALIVTLNLLSPGLGTGAARADEASVLGVQGLPKNDVAKIKETILGWTDTLAKGDLDAWDSYWAKDSVLLPPGTDPVIGNAKRNAIAKHPPYDNIAKVNFSNWAVAGRDDLAVVSNTVTIERKSGGAPSAFKQIIVLRLDGGKWLVQAVMFNANG